MPALHYEFMSVQLYRDKLHLFLNTPNSGDAKSLWTWMEKKKLQVINGARRQVGVRTGALRKNISGRHFGFADGQRMSIGADLPYALMHHEGTKPHTITPQNGKLLHFRVGTRSVYTTMVRHPGTKPNRYLSDQLIRFTRP